MPTYASFFMPKCGVILRGGIEPKPFSSLKTFCGDFNAALIRHAIIGTCASILGAHIADCGKIPSTVLCRAICRLEQNPHTK